jgi:hypothetical protein
MPTAFAREFFGSHLKPQIRQGRCPTSGKFLVLLVYGSQEVPISTHKTEEACQFGVQQNQKCLAYLGRQFWNQPFENALFHFCDTLNQKFPYPDDDESFWLRPPTQPLTPMDGEFSRKQ